MAIPADDWEYDEQGGHRPKARTTDAGVQPTQTPPTFVVIPDVSAVPRWTRTRLADGFDEEALGWREDSTIGLFFTAIRGGSKRRQAAQYAGISHDRMKFYLGEGYRNWPDDEDDIPALPMPQRMYCALLYLTQRLEGLVGVEVTNAWREMSMRDWRSAQQFMRQRFEEDWYQKQGIEVTGRIELDTDDLAAAIFGDNQEMHELLSKVEESLALPRGEESRMPGIGPLEDLDADYED